MVKTFQKDEIQDSIRGMMGGGGFLQEENVSKEVIANILNDLIKAQNEKKAEV